MRKIVITFFYMMVDNCDGVSPAPTTAVTTSTTTSSTSTTTPLLTRPNQSMVIMVLVLGLALHSSSLWSLL